MRPRRRTDELQTEEISVDHLGSQWAEGTLKQVERLLSKRFDRHQSELIKVLLRRKRGEFSLDNVVGSSVTHENLHAVQHLALGAVLHGEDGVVGATCLSLVKGRDRRASGFWCVEVLLFAVHKQFERNGIGRRLIDAGCNPVYSRLPPYV